MSTSDEIIEQQVAKVRQLLADDRMIEAREQILLLEEENLSSLQTLRSVTRCLIDLKQGGSALMIAHKYRRKSTAEPASVLECAEVQLRLGMKLDPILQQLLLVFEPSSCEEKIRLGSIWQRFHAYPLAVDILRSSLDQ